jgi:TRAP transporter TAXI family solute receptor
MRKHMKKMFSLALILCMVLTLAACGSSETPAETPADAPANTPADAPAEITVQDINIQTGPSGGTMEIVGAAAIEIFKEVLPGVQFSSVLTTGSAVNINMMVADEGDLGIITADTFAAAINGQSPFEAPVEGLASLCALYPNTIQLWSLPEANINDFSDLAGHTFTCGQYGGGPYQPCMNMLATFGMTEEDCDITPLAWGEATSNLQDGNIDAVFWTTSYPAAGIVNASVGRDFKLVQINRDKLAEYKNTYEGWVDVTIPAGTYTFQNEDVYTVGTPNLFVIREDVPEEVAYQLTKAICENYAALGAAHALLLNLNDDTVAQGLVGNVHPGALRYYQEMGIKVN